MLNRQERPEPAREAATEPKFRFVTDVALVSPKGGHYMTLNHGRRKLAKADVQNGILSQDDKDSHELSQALGHVLGQLRQPERVLDPGRRAAIDDLTAGKPVFFEVPPDAIGEELKKAAQRLDGSTPGVILMPIANDIVQEFSAVRFSDGRMARLMPGPVLQEPKDFERRLNLLAPPTRVTSMRDGSTSLAIEFVKDGKEPTRLSRAQIDGWLERVRLSGLVFDFDVDHGHPVLDNFLERSERDLVWIDGNISLSRPAKDETELERFIAEQRSVLEKLL